MILRRVVVDEADRLLRRIVRQAEDDGVGRVQQLGARGRVLALAGIDRDELQVAPALQPLADLQAGGAGFAVDEDFRTHGSNLMNEAKEKGRSGCPKRPSNTRVEAT